MLVAAPQHPIRGSQNVRCQATRRRRPGASGHSPGADLGLRQGRHRRFRPRARRARRGDPLHRRDVARPAGGRPRRHRRQRRDRHAGDDGRPRQDAASKDPRRPAGAARRSGPRRGDAGARHRGHRLPGLEPLSLRGDACRRRRPRRDDREHRYRRAGHDPRRRQERRLGRGPHRPGRLRRRAGGAEGRRRAARLARTACRARLRPHRRL